jgi:hypothetical protein
MKYQLIFNSLCGVISQRTDLFMTTAVRASNTPWMFTGFLLLPKYKMIWKELNTDRLLCYTNNFTGRKENNVVFNK